MGDLGGCGPPGPPADMPGLQGDPRRPHGGSRLLVLRPRLPGALRKQGRFFDTNAALARRGKPVQLGLDPEFDEWFEWRVYKQPMPHKTKRDFPTEEWAVWDACERSFWATEVEEK